MLVLDEVQCGVGPHRQALRPRALRDRARHPRHGQGHRRRVSARRLPRDRKSRVGHGRRHARLDLRRQSAGDGGGQWRCSTSSPTTNSSADVQQMGERLRAALEQIIPNHDDLFDSVRGMGLMLGVKMKVESRAFVGYLRDRGLLTVAAGDNVVPRASAAGHRGKPHPRIRRQIVGGCRGLRGSRRGVSGTRISSTSPMPAGKRSRRSSTTHRTARRRARAGQRAAPTPTARSTGMSWG